MSEEIKKCTLVTGASDDSIELRGKLYEEFYEEFSSYMMLLYI